MTERISIKVQTNTHCFVEKQWVFAVLGQWFGLDFALSGGQVADYQLQLSGGKVLRIADHFFKVVQPGVYGRENLPKAKTTIQLKQNSQTRQWFALYGSGNVEVSEQEVSLDADLIGTVFFMLSRWEEQIAPEKDLDGRLAYQHHVAARLGLAQQPFLDAWADLFEVLFELSGYVWKQPRLKNGGFELSCDVDIPFLWQQPIGRWKTILGALVARRDPGEAAYWLRQPYQNEQKKDPCATYHHLMDIAEANNSRCIFHFLGDRPRHFDHYYPLTDHRLVQIKDEIHARGHEIGFHPSRQAVRNAEQYKREFESVEAFSGREVRRVRTHYLADAGPFTWNLHAEHGVAIDSSFGFYDQCGFRCGTAQAFPLFDWKTRRIVGVQEQPLIAMDVALVLAQKLSPAVALEKLTELQRAIEPTNGTFTLLWHNSSFYTWPWYPYRDLPKQCLHAFD